MFQSNISHSHEPSTSRLDPLSLPFQSTGAEAAFGPRRPRTRNKAQRKLITELDNLTRRIARRFARRVAQEKPGLRTPDQLALCGKD